MLLGESVKSVFGMVPPADTAYRRRYIRHLSRRNLGKVVLSLDGVFESFSLSRLALLELNALLIAVLVRLGYHLGNDGIVLCVRLCVDRIP